MSESHNTLEDVLIDLLMRGDDRGALVRPAQEGREPVVCVLLMSAIAVERIVPALHPITLELGSREFVPVPGEPFDEHIGLRDLAEFAERSPVKWGSFEMRFGRTLVRAIMFSGLAVCERVAAICTANGAPCSLDPDQAAPGYVIERRVER